MYQEIDGHANVDDDQGDSEVREIETRFLGEIFTFFGCV